MIAPRPHMRRSMATVLAESDYRKAPGRARHCRAYSPATPGRPKARLAHALGAGRMTEEAEGDSEAA
jgi:hypothetical protein